MKTSKWLWLITPYAQACLCFALRLLDQNMTEDNNNNEEYSSEAIHNKSKKGSQDKELLKVLEALESQGFKLFDYHENWFGSSLNIKWLEHLTISPY